jgi:hypothetical protein
MGEALALTAQGCGRKGVLRKGLGHAKRGIPAIAGCRRAVKTARVYTLSSQERKGLYFLRSD